MANNGSYVLTVSGGVAQCVRDDHESDRIFTPRGLALLYAGVQSCANLRACGLLSGGDLGQDLDWDAVFGGRQAHVRDYF